MADQDDEDRAFIEQITEALLTGRKIEAIKLYRERTGCGLKEAKDEIEVLAANLKTRHPEKFPDRPKQGCAGALLQIVFALLFACFATATLLGR